MQAAFSAEGTNLTARLGGIFRDPRHTNPLRALVLGPSILRRSIMSSLIQIALIMKTNQKCKTIKSSMLVCNSEYKDII